MYCRSLTYSTASGHYSRTPHWESNLWGITVKKWKLLEQFNPYQNSKCYKKKKMQLEKSWDAMKNVNKYWMQWFAHLMNPYFSQSRAWATYQMVNWENVPFKNKIYSLIFSLIAAAYPVGTGTRPHCLASHLLLKTVNKRLGNAETSSWSWARKVVPFLSDRRFWLLNSAESSFGFLVC